MIRYVQYGTHTYLVPYRGQGPKSHHRGLRDAFLILIFFNFSSINIFKNYTIKKQRSRRFSWCLSILTIFDSFWSSSGVNITIVLFYFFYFGHRPPAFRTVCFGVDLYYVKNMESFRSLMEQRLPSKRTKIKNFNRRRALCFTPILIVKLKFHSLKLSLI